MKKIAIISNGYAWFPVEPGPSRFFYIANVFVNAGWNVEVITTSFQHFKKEPRNQELILSQGYPFKITFIHTPSYKKNIDIRRIFSNRVTAQNTVKYLIKNIHTYDAVYCSIPANDVAARVSEICKKNNVPFVVDIEDLWPEAMSMILKNDAIRNFLLQGMNRDAEIAYANASGVIGTSEDYTDRAFKHRKRNIPNETVYVGCDLTQFDEGVKQYKDEIEKPEQELWVTYAGSIGTSYDIRTMVDAGKELLNENKNIKIQILGTGPLKEALEKHANEIGASNVRFWGYVPYPKMAAVLSKSDVLINSFVKGAPQSIVNKIGDYLAAGKPIINTLENPVFCKLVRENGIGENVAPGDPKALVKAIEEVISSKKGYGIKARELAVAKFDRRTSYNHIINMIEMINDKSGMNK